MEQRIRLVIEHGRGDLSMAALCIKYGVSRKTGYKWLARAAADGLDQLGDRSRAPHHHPNQVTAEIEQAILAMRAAHPTWGPKKVLRRLQDQDGRTCWPARSTIAELLRRHGLVSPRRFRRRVAPSQQPFANCDGPNATWCVDFKGWFRTGDGRRCEPLTISDAFSRYLIRCQSVRATSGRIVRPLFEAAFREFGLPRAIRSDNGPPFASMAIGGLSRLSVWWIKLGIAHERIEPGKPQQNGRHERMHLTLKQDTASPPASTHRAQQRRFDSWRKEYNDRRPHEALDLCTPGSLYAASPRPYRPRLQEMSYPSAWSVRRVRHNGEVKLRGRFFLSEALTGELVGFEPLDERYYRVHFGPLALGLFDTHAHRLLKPAEAKRRGLVVRPPACDAPSASLHERRTQEPKV